MAELDLEALRRFLTNSPSANSQSSAVALQGPPHQVQQSQSAQQRQQQQPQSGQPQDVEQRRSSQSGESFASQGYAVQHLSAGDSQELEQNEEGDRPSENAIEFDKELFLEEVRKYRCLWDINSEAYKNRPIKQNAWTLIGKLFNRDGEFLPTILKK